MISIYDQQGLEALRSRTAVQPHRFKLFRNAFFKKGLGKEGALAVLPGAARSVFGREVGFQCLELSGRRDSETDGATKLGFQTLDGHLIESVILRVKTGRTALCISSQVGCVCKCGFCATGQLGFSRNLTYGEILDQVAQANRLLRAEGRTVRNVVLMGMGEPFQNLENVFQSLEVLQDATCFNLAGMRLMVSTVGIPDAMVQCAERFPCVQLALSLHSARQQVREKLMPLARKYNLDALHEAMAVIGRSRKVMVEYLMLEGVNDGDEDFQALENYLRDIPVHINIIPFNEFEGCGLKGTPHLARKAFADRLKDAGFNVTLRYSLGSDIAAACGQLVRRRMREGFA
ncbi:MAG: 23S rRNA (adenine(2503)-C(2))-methyltransferase RlmN [Kiritimatiellales bacterium]|nr:23S rRNA (adenine(2503)-C(2))-methyltransferase RlmN [Kiritimatiellales bacterium]